MMKINILICDVVQTGTKFSHEFAASTFRSVWPCITSTVCHQWRRFSKGSAPLASLVLSLVATFRCKDRNRTLGLSVWYENNWKGTTYFGLQECIIRVILIGHNHIYEWRISRRVWDLVKTAASSLRLSRHLYLTFLYTWTLKMGPIGCLETMLRNYHYSLRNNPEERGSYVLRDVSLKSRIEW